MISIAIEKRLKVYQGQQVLKVNLQRATGSITQLLGPSGSGKTTFLKTIAGLISPDSGTIIVQDKTWFDAVKKINVPVQQRHVGFVFQQYALFPNMTVKAHLQYATNDEAWIKQLLLLGKLDTMEQHKPEQLSGGQQQRLAILRALSTKPPLLLMDEPFSALDRITKQELIAELKVLLKSMGTTVLIVSHNPQELDGWADGELLFE